ncbi:MAG: alpha/beta hydrolase [Chromatiales bacterium]|nr:alpha/beta hydrolase [Chromatiales bacterium]
MLRTLTLLLLYGTGAWALLVLMMFVLQDRLVYLPGTPGRALVATPDAVGLPWREVWLEAGDGVRLHAWHVPGQPGEVTMLFLHGNAGNISHRLDWLRILHGLGVNVLLLEYRGYGRSEGRPSEEGLALDARAAWDWLREEAGVPAGRIVLFGESLGAAVAARLASETAPGGLVLFSAFTSVPDVAALHYPYVPARRLARIQHATIDWLPRVASPVLLMHSPDDEIVPWEQAQRLLAVAPEPRLFVQTRGDHNTGFLLSEALIREGIRAFLALHLGSGPDSAQLPQNTESSIAPSTRR